MKIKDSEVPIKYNATAPTKTNKRAKDLSPQPNPKTMSEGELIGVFLGKDKEMAGLQLLENYNGISGLSQATVLHLIGVGKAPPAGALRIRCAYELANRLAIARRPMAQKISDATDVWNLLGHEMKHLDHEQFRVLLLGGRNELLSIETIATGQRDSCVVHSSDVFRSALLRKACSLILMHNHPSGDPSPSPEDCAMTRKIVSGGSLIGISVLDHIIIGSDSYCSLREEGLIG